MKDILQSNSSFIYYFLHNFRILIKAINHSKYDNEFNFEALNILRNIWGKGELVSASAYLLLDNDIINFDFCEYEHYDSRNSKFKFKKSHIASFDTLFDSIENDAKLSWIVSKQLRYFYFFEENSNIINIILNFLNFVEDFFSLSLTSL
jgi:hypothetical protein